MNLKNFLLASLLVCFNPFALCSREINLYTGNPDNGKLTIYITKVLPFYLLEKKGWVNRDILVSIWLEWAKISQTSLSFELVDSPSSVEPRLEGKNLYIWETALPEPQLDLQDLSSSSLIKNQLSLIQRNAHASNPDLKIGVVADLYSTWLSLDDKLIDRKKILIYTTRTSLVKDMENGKINALVDYPMAFWHLAKKPHIYSIKPVNTQTCLPALKPEVTQACWKLEEELLSIPTETLLQLKKQHISLLAEKDKPYLMVSLEKNYAPFSYSKEEKPEGLFVSYAHSYLRILGVPYTLSFWQDNPSQTFDIRWGLRCENEKKGIFSFYKTPLILLPLRDLVNISNPQIGYQVTEDQLSEYKKIYPQAEWLYESNLQTPVDAWVWEGARLPKNLLERENKTLLSQTTLYQKMLYFYLGANEELEPYFKAEGLKILEKTSLLEWQEMEKKWVENPLYRSFIKLDSFPTLSNEEKTWVFQHPHLRLGVDSKGGLLESFDQDSSSSLVDIFLRKITEPLGLKIHKVPILNSSHLASLWEKGEIDAYISYSKKTYQRTQDTYSFCLWQIPLFLYREIDKKMPDNLLAELQKSSLGMWSKLAEEKPLDNTFSEILYFPSPIETFHSLILGNCDWIFMDSYNAHLLERKYKQNIQPLLRYPLDINLVLNVQSNKPVLFKLLERSYLSLSPAQKADMVQRWIESWQPKAPNYWNIFLLLPFLITLLSTNIINYKSFSAKLRYREDLNKKLLEAEKRANQANASKSEFIANISHELRTCLNGIIGMSELLKKTPLDQQQEEYFSILRSSSQTLVTIVDDLLDVSRIENKRIHLENTPFSLVSYLKGIIDNMKKVNSNPKINILLRTLNLPNELIRGDFIRLGQILSNLIRNSLKFTESGLIKLTVSSHKRQVKKIWIEFKVEDTGIGIPEGRLKDLFEPFSQVHDNLSVKKGGVGLGLYICRSLVELMGGTPLEVNSKVGVGSIFSFKIPFQLTHLIADQLEEYSLEEFKNTQALILERNPKQIVSFCEILLKMGLSYKIASSPSEVLSFLQREIFDVFFVEEEFLEKEGSSLFLIPYHNYPKDKIFILSSSIVVRNEQLQKTLKEQGYYDFISYPYEKQEILSKLREFLKTVGKHSNTSLNYERHAFKDTKILLVEDHSVNQKVLSFMLENLGIQVDLASQGEEALFIFKKNSPYDLVFMDIQLPDKNGFTVAQEIREWEKTYKQSYTPIISITANAMHGYKKLCLEKGLDDYLSKPIFSESLLSMLKNWISENKRVSFKEEKQLQGLREVNFLPNIPYLNLPQTLINLDLEIETYLPMLAQAYKACYNQLFLPISSYAHGSRTLDKEELHKLVHTLAGVLGNLGALELFQDLKECEKWIDKEESQEKTSLLEKTVYKLDKFFSVLSKLTNSQEQQEQKVRRKRKHEESH